MLVNFHSAYMYVFLTCWLQAFCLFWRNIVCQNFGKIYQFAVKNIESLTGSKMCVVVVLLLLLYIHGE